MRYLAPMLAATAALCHAVHANFDIYRVGIGGNGITDNTEGWQVYGDEANCDVVMGWSWADTDDASGRGVRCVSPEGNGCGRGDDANSSDITVLEMNFVGYHWTYYKDRNGGDLVDTNNNPVGKCYPFPGPYLECGLEVSRLEGYRKLRCEIDVTADQINSNRFGRFRRG